ncbi:MAG: DUF4124 domain-containing protein [Comamonadaceae bacterium SCN 68-20]|nr:MAG: DUF4124 domain-containing protein [Comamonadaceae bacterium SCN 68-20]OJX28058.1 MAG: DUF4124 domain-containing protein [Burkholderiales bacterium 68-20]
MTQAARIIAVGLWLASLGMGAQAQKAAPAGPSSIYSCIDASGRRITADRPIPECADREQRVLSPSGMVRERLGPVLSDQERSAREAQRRKEAEENARVAEERRRERALMARYPNQAAHDAERTAALEQVDQLTAVAEKRMVELQVQRKKFDTEMEFYARDPNKAPMYLRRAVAENDDAMAEQQRFVAGQAQEKRSVHQRFDTELVQLRKLWAARAAPPSPESADGTGKP